MAGTRLPRTGSKLDVSPPTRPRRSPSQRYPSTALFQGMGSQNPSRNDIDSPQDSPDPQRLPRPQAAPSLAGSSIHASTVQQSTADRRPSSQQAFSMFQSSSIRPDDFQPEALWAEMQRTLADVEVAALNTNSSSHIFGASHSVALEELRTAQLALAQAWARSEADEIGGTDAGDSDGSSSGSATIRKVDGLTASPAKSHTKGGHASSPKSRRRASSVASTGAMAEDLEAETERDIQLARMRRAANDRYFKQVNNGVLDVVAKLDEVANAMKAVERESRDVWEDGSITSTDGEDSKQPAGNQDRTVNNIDEHFGLEHNLTRTNTTNTGGLSNTDTELWSDSPETPKKADGKKGGEGTI